MGEIIVACLTLVADLFSKITWIKATGTAVNSLKK